MTIEDCLFENNFAAGTGGAVLRTAAGNLSVTGSQFVSQMSMGGHGGAIHNVSPMTVTNCTFADNSALNEGGAVWNTGPGLMTVQNTILTNSLAGGITPDANGNNVPDNCDPPAPGVCGAGCGPGPLVLPLSMIGLAWTKRRGSGRIATKGAKGRAEEQSLM